MPLSLLDPEVKKAESDKKKRNVSEQKPLLITSDLDRTVRVGRIRTNASRWHCSCWISRRQVGAWGVSPITT